MSFEPDPAQRQVLEHERGALLVSGGSGTGKTTVLRERSARLIESGADPERLILVVRTRRARDDIRASLMQRLDRSLPSLRVTTVHGLAFDVISRRFATLGYGTPPVVLDAADQFAKVQDLIGAEDPVGWPAFGRLLDLRGFADQVRQFLLRAQEAMWSPAEIAARATERELTGWAEIAGFYERYLAVLAFEGALDFPGLILAAARAAAEAPPAYDHVLVDDYHDATLGTQHLLESLRPGSLVVAGNLGAHVFSFQGATDRPLREFAGRFAAAEVRLLTDHRDAGRTIEAWRSAHTSEEHAWVARELRRIHVQDGVPWAELGVVVRRQSAQVAGLLRALDDAGVPRTSAGSGLPPAAAPSTRPYVLALRWIVAGPSERDDLIEQVLTSELGAVSPASARTVLRLNRAKGRRPAEALAGDEGLDEDELRSLQDLRLALAEADDRRGSVVDAFAALWRRLPYSRRLVLAGGTTTEAQADLEAVVTFSRAVAEAGDGADPSVEAFLEGLETGAGGPELAAEGARGRDEVHVLTAHAAAGLEFDTVIVVGAVEGNFPSLTRPEPMFDLAVLERPRPRSEVLHERIADERRLFQMVLGLARRRVVLAASEPHGDERNIAIASRFVDELGLDWRRVETPLGAEPVSVAEAAALWRRTLADPLEETATRLAAIDGLLALRTDPSRWWFQRDWSPSGTRALPADEPLHLSYSRLSKLENCELQYVLADELGLDTGGGHQAWVGRLIHALIETCEAGAIARTPEALAEEVNARWRPERFPSMAISELERRNAVDVLIPNWFARYGALPAPSTERGFAFEYDGARLRGVIDRIGPAPEGGTRITDFKTGRSDRAPKASESLQLGIYYLAVNEVDELRDQGPITGVELAFLAGRRSDDSHADVRSWDVTPGAEEGYQTQMRERLSNLISTIRQRQLDERWIASTKAECMFCAFQTLCPRYAEGTPVFPIREAAS